MERTRHSPSATGSPVTRVSTCISRSPLPRGSIKSSAGSATLTEKQIRRGTHRSTRQLKDAIRNYLELNNAHPKPIVWTKSADDIMASIERFCMRISNSEY